MIDNTSFTKRGVIWGIFGCMFSGKTSELLRLLKRSQIAGKTVRIYKPEIDKRYSETEVCSHDNSRMESKVFFKAEEILQDINEALENKDCIDVVGIDEVEFSDSKVVDVILKIRSLGIDVYIAGLNRTSEGVPFPFTDGKDHVGTIMAYCDLIITPTAVCTEPGCGIDATMTYYRSHKNDAVDVGGLEKYTARCPSHWRINK